VQDTGKTTGESGGAADPREVQRSTSCTNCRCHRRCGVRFERVAGL